MGGFDRYIFDFLSSIANRSALLDGLFIFLAKYLIWLVLLIAVLAIFRKKDWGNDLPLWKNRFQYIALASIATILSRGIVANVINTLYISPRPFAALGTESLFYHADVNSFPSGHITLLVPIVLTLFLVNKKAAWWSLLLTLIIGVMRVVSSVHWPSDILAGFLIGLLSFWIVKTSFRRKKLI